MLAGAGLPAWPDGPRLLVELNTVPAEEASRHDAFVADVHAHFHGHGASTGDPRPANRELWYCGVIEPNAYGAHEIRSVWWHALWEQDLTRR